MTNVIFEDEKEKYFPFSKDKNAPGLPPGATRFVKRPRKNKVLLGLVWFAWIVWGAWAAVYFFVLFDAEGAAPIVEPVIIPIVIQGKNFSGMTTPTLTALEYRNCNFSQSVPVLVEGKWVGVRLWPGDDTPRTFFECNLTNALPAAGSTLTRCNTTLRRSVVATGTTETLTVDGAPVNIPEYADMIYGRTNPTTLKAEYKATVLRILTDPPEGTEWVEIKRFVEEREEARAVMEAKEAAAKAKVAELEAVK